MKAHSNRGIAGFTMFEVLLAAVLAMILMFGALMSTGESYSVAREADKRLHTHVTARKSMDTLLKQIRYSSALSIAGSEAAGWTITVDTTDSLNPGQLVYAWNPNTKEITVSDGVQTDVSLSGVSSFTLQTTLEGAETSRVTMEWVVEVDAGQEAGNVQVDETLALGGSTWVQRFAPLN